MKPAADALSEELLGRVQRRLAGSAATPRAVDVAAAVRAEAGLVSDAQLLRLIRAATAELVGAGPLAELLADSATTDVVVNAPDDVRVDRGHGWEPAGIRFPDDAAVQRLARRLAASAQRRLDDARPYVDAQLPGGVRLHAVLPPVAAGGTCLSLRVLRPAGWTLSALEQAGAFPPSILSLLRRMLDARIAFLVTGGTGSGKTTLLSALLGEVSADERILTVEDVAELRPAHPHTVSLIARNTNVEGAGLVSLRDLVRQALRMRPDRLVIGEVRGPEVVDLLIALNTGHRGCAGTVHANRPAEVPVRLTALAALDGLPESAVTAQLRGSVQAVIHVARDRGGRRRIAEIGVAVTHPGGGVRVECAYAGDGEPGPAAHILTSLLEQTRQ